MWADGHDGAALLKIDKIEKLVNKLEIEDSEKSLTRHSNFINTECKL